MAKYGSYLFKRSGSQNWHIRFRYTGKLAERFNPIHDESLGTPDRKEAEIKALPLIRAHKMLLLMLRNKEAGTFKKVEKARRYEPGEHRGDSGERIIATSDTLVIIHPDGRIEQEPNAPVVELTLKMDEDERRTLRALDKKIAPKKADPDEAILENWIKLRGIRKNDANEARAVYRRFKELVPKPFAACDRDDGRKLAQSFFDEGKKSRTVMKQVGYLASAVKIAIDDQKLKFNPFTNVVPKMDDKLIRLPLSDEDMALMKAYLPEIGAEEQLLWTWLATTGMRVSEPFQATEEFRENGVRYIIVGRKTEESRRRVPIPELVLPMLPSRITGPVFKNTPHNLGRNLVRALRRVGITDERKVVHSLRHRVKDKLRLLRCPLDVQYQILGHEEKTVASGYGLGYPADQLKTWIDQISV